jgi:hypothetical protein
MSCRRCGNKLTDSARFCGKCGQPVEQAPVDQVVAEPSPARTVGQIRRPLPMILWSLFTLNLYWWFYWIPVTYRELRAHSPNSTKVTPARAVGFLFIPFFNIYWFFRVPSDLPRTVLRIQEDHRLDKSHISPGQITAIAVIGFVVNLLSGVWGLGLAILEATHCLSTHSSSVSAP